MDSPTSGRKWTTREFQGVLEAEDLKDRIESHLADAAPGSTLWDFRRAELSGISHAFILSLARALGADLPTDPTCRNALVFSTPYGFGLGRTFEMGADCSGAECEIRCFYRLTDATGWLWWPESETPGMGRGGVA